MVANASFTLLQLQILELTVQQLVPSLTPIEDEEDDAIPNLPCGEV